MRWLDGASGLRVSRHWRETRAHFSAIIGATPLSCMLYNNPIAYGTDVTAEQLAELAEAARQPARREGVERRCSARDAPSSRLGERLNVFAGLDDMIVESVAVGASGWIAGLVNALPEESVRLFDLARAGRTREARTLYEWFLPLLRLDTSPNSCSSSSWRRSPSGAGHRAVRPPRLQLEGEELRGALAVIRRQLDCRPRAQRRGRRGRSDGTPTEASVVAKADPPAAAQPSG